MKPYENQQFDVPDTVWVEAELTDDKALRQVQISLLDENLIPAFQTISLAASGRDFKIKYPYVLDDLYLSSGIYYIKITVFDDKGEKNAYQKINVNAVPKVREGVFLLSSTSDQSFNIYQLDSTHTLIFQSNIPGDFLEAAIDSRHQILYSLGEFTGDFNAYDLKSKSIICSQPGGVGVPFFEGYQLHQQQSLLSYFKKEIRVFDNKCQQDLLIKVNELYYPRKTYVHGNFLLSEEKELAGHNDRLILYYFPSGKEYQQVMMKQEVLQFFSMNTQRVFIVGNEGAQAKMEIYEVEGNYLWSPHDFPSGGLLAAEQIDANTYLFAHSDGNIYRYTYSNNSLISYQANTFGIDLNYDDLSAELYVAEKNKLNVYDYASNTLKRSIVHPDTIKQVLFLYNKP